MADAMAIATEARQQIRSHEDLCAERYRGIERATAATGQQLDEIKKLISKNGDDRKADMKGIYDFLWRIALGVGGAMFVIILALVKEVAG